MRKIVLANQKGGVGKTTTVLNLAAGLALAGKRTLAIDLDPQANLTFAALARGEPDLTSYDLLLGDRTPSEVITQTDQGFDLIPSDIDLSGAEIDLIGAVGGQIRLSNRLSKLTGYDFVVIDAPPSLGYLTINCLVAAGEVIIPVNVSVFALKGIIQLERTIEDVRRDLNHEGLRLAGVLATMTENTNISRDVVGLIRERFGALTFETTIPKNVKIEEAHSRGESVLTYAPDSTGAKAYQELTEEVITRG